MTHTQVDRRVLVIGLYRREGVEWHLCHPHPRHPSARWACVNSQEQSQMSCRNLAKKDHTTQLILRPA